MKAKPARTQDERISALAAGLLAGDRRALAKAITRVESTRPADVADARALLAAVLPNTGRALRIGLSGAPGVGKSTFTEALGTYLTAHGKTVAVLAVDPSSRRSGGSILGDKTRMERLSRDPRAFIRPSPAGRTLGGVARRTRETLLLVEAAGFDVVLVETVGVGQSETAVADMTDMFVLLLAPGGGDDLQGIKRGIMELADLVVVNKADGDLVAAAHRAAADYQTALHLMRPKNAHWRAEVKLASALENRGIAEVWTVCQAYRESQSAHGHLAAQRAAQARTWLWTELSEDLADALHEDPVIAAETARLEAEVAAGRVLPGEAARRLLDLFRKR